MVRRLSLALLACLALAACDKKDPPAPDPGVPGGDIEVSGNERIGWSQPAADALQLALFQYVVYVDGARTFLTSVSCGSSATAAGFDCSAALPSLTTGTHTLELAAVVMDPSGILESSRSAPLRVVKTGTAATTSAFTSTPVMTADGISLNLERVTDGLSDPSDLAFGADGTIFVAERRGTVRAIKSGILVPGPALDLSGDVELPHGGLLAVTLDPNFAETGFMYTLSAAGDTGGGLEFMLARFRGVEDSFGDRAVLLDRIPAAPEGANGTLRAGPDGKLYVALDSGGDGRTAGSLGSYNGKVLRLNVDATTPDDQPGHTPIHSLDHSQPKALDWQPVSGDLWIIDGVNPSGGRLSTAASPNPQQGRRAVMRTAYTLPQGTGASSAVFYRGDLLPAFRGDLWIAAETGRELIRLQFDPDNMTRVTSVERLLKDEVGPIRVVAEGRDGTLYLASHTALYRLKP
jgi:glucose/arabinose dehydrogenase